MNISKFAPSIGVGAVFCFASVISMNGWADAWNEANNPARMNPNYIRKLSDLPLKGAVDQERLPWSDTYWPSKKGGLAWRWQSDQKAKFSFNYELLSPASVKSMSRESLM